MEIKNFDKGKSNVVCQFGVEWFLSSCTKVDNDDGEDYFEVFLYVNHDLKNQ